MPEFLATADVPIAVKDNAFLLLGPTAVGKSDLAVALAERVGGEIVSADAFQVYAGLDTLSAKPQAPMRARVPHHLIGEIPLTEHFDVAQWLTRARQHIKDIASRGLVPIVCGGTGLYLRALRHGLAELPPADPHLRAELERESLSTLAARLRSLDPATEVDLNNPRRVIRALEVCMLSHRPFSSFKTEWRQPPRYQGVILTRPRQDLLARIEARTEAMFATGVVEEVASLESIGPTAAQMLGLTEIRMLLADSSSRSDCIAAIRRATSQYSRRQMIWLRKEPACEWLDLATETDALGVLERAVMALRSQNAPS